MNNKERLFIVTILFIIMVMVSIDLVTDSNEGVKWWHLLVEGSIAIAALFGIFFLLKDSIVLKKSLENEKEISAKLQVEAEKWRLESRKYLEGLSRAIDQQLDDWKLTIAEKEVTFLLLKGLSLKEIAEIRKTTEKTARAQSVAIYAKAGLSGRSELAAFFLEDLLIPTVLP